MSKKNINELNLVSRFVGDFFDGLSKGTADRIIRKGASKGLPKDLVNKMAKIEKERQELDAIIKKYS
jgi:hypothetical protein